MEYLFASFTFSLYVSLGLMWISCKQHIYGSSFCIHSINLYLLVGAFSSFTFKVTIDAYVPIGIFLFVECKVKWALGSITTNKASEDDGIPAELFQILKDDAVKVLHSICKQICKTQQWPQDWKMLVFIPMLKKGNAKECSNYHTIALTC